ncbi:MAG: SDR family oxidoreductase [Desulfobacteraceae bacterium]|nr:SDR family oxidoreductase [Desulfobacteraceae bacterium]MBC2756998.1 SDR family oxidoreductase [Desulfobacteraceae bacterium]
MNPFHEKVAIVTGAASGIGQALAEELCSRGTHVILTDWKEEQVCTVSDGISSTCGSATPVCLDVTDFEVFKKIVDDTVQKYGRLDYIFNNAGIAVGGEVRDVTIEDWRDVLNVNLNGVVHGVAAAYPVMVKQGFGHIINTASLEGLVAFPGNASYVASKHAVVGLSNSLRVEGKALGVKVSVVCPGHIKTAIFNDSKLVNIDRKKVLEYVAKVPGITPAECAKVIIKGVEKNKAIIVVTMFAKILYALQRLSPTLTMKLIMHDVKKLRDARITD